MAEEILCTGSVHDLATLVAAFNFPPEAYVLVERLPQQVVNDAERQNLLRFARLHDIDRPRDRIDIASYTSGRIFYRDFELRWEKDSSGTNVVFLGTKEVYRGAQRDIPELTPDEDTLKELVPQAPRYYYLFGQLLDADEREQMGIKAAEGEEYYAEVRIPRLLRYPDPEPSAPKKAQRVQLTVREYADNRTGRVELFRFQDLRPAE